MLSRHGIAYDGRARQISPADFNRFDYILAMDDSNLADLRAMAPTGSRATIRRFLDFADDLPTREVPDPYYDGRFEEVYALVRQGAGALLAHLRQEHGL